MESPAAPHESKEALDAELEALRAEAKEILAKGPPATPKVELIADTLDKYFSNKK